MYECSGRAVRRAADAYLPPEHKCGLLGQDAVDEEEMNSINGEDRLIYRIHFHTYGLALCVQALMNTQKKPLQKSLANRLRGS